VLTVTVEKRLAALKSSTQINGFQHLFLRLHFSEANASGMVSFFPHFIYASSNASFFIAARMYGFSFQRMMDAPIFCWLLISSWAHRQTILIPFALNGHF